MRAHIHTWGDLKQYGINALTGEACKYSMRLLCDLNEDGIELVRDIFGMQIVLNPNAQFAANWNSMVGDKPALVSIMLPRDMFGTLCRYILFKSGCDIVLWAHDGGWCGYTNDELPAGMTMDKLNTMYKAVYRNPAPTASSSRNEHAFTGRTL